MVTPGEELVCVPELARRWSVSREDIMDLRARGELPWASRGADRRLAWTLTDIQAHEATMGPTGSEVAR